MNPNIIPQDSCLHNWCRILSYTEIPVSYQIAGGITFIGSLLRRQVYVDQQTWKVYPNQSVLFVGPSGIGKDTIINCVTKEVERYGIIPVLGGKTSEGIGHRLSLLGQLAAAYIPAGELSAFFGQRDYQSGMIQTFTDYLSNGEKLDISTKGDLGFGGKPKYIYKPTLTFHGGSTEEWLHKAMPDGTMEGGFLGRFLIIVEALGGKHVALVKRGMDKEDTALVEACKAEWDSRVREIIPRYKTPIEMTLLPDAEEYYTNWYHNRFRYFSKVVTPYANRSRDMVLRLAMLMAVSRRHWNWIDAEDVKFGVEVLIEVGKSIDKVILPPTIEAQAGRMILQVLPATTVEIWRALSQKFLTRVLQQAILMLEASGQIWRDGKVYKRKE